MRGDGIMRGVAFGGAIALLAVIGVALLTWVAGGPVGMLPGGRLSGDPAETAEPDLRRLAERETIEIEVRPGQPRSVTTWVLVDDSAVYIPADFMLSFKRWPKYVLEDPRIKIRTEGLLYSGLARRVESARRVQELRLAVAAKYGVEPDGLAANSDVWFFRVDFRGPAASGSDSN